MERKLRARLPGGAFRNVPPARSKAMSAVRSSGNKTTEVRLRLALVRAAISGWRMHTRDIPGRPDFFFPKEEVAIFVDGCFWHGCRRCGHVPRTRSAFWGAKIRRNRQRDRKTDAVLRAKGITPVHLWEHQLMSDSGACVRAILRALES